MKHPALSLAVFTLATLVAPELARSAAPTRDLVIRDVRVIDVVAGRASEPRTVVVREGRIAAIYAKAPTSTTDLVIDGHGKWLIPGLWDMHTHALWDTVALRTFIPALVASGVTGIRDMGGTLPVLAQARAEAKAHPGAWPHIVAAGPVLDGPSPVDPSISVAITTAGDARRAVDSLAAAGVDFIKVYTLLDREPFFAALDQARKRGLPVAGHIPHEIGAAEAARLGMRSIEHMRAEVGCYCQMSDSGACDSLLRRFREKSVWQTPTLAPRVARARAADSTLGDAPEFRVVPASLMNVWRSGQKKKLRTRPPSYFEGLAADLRNEMWLAGATHRAKVPILVGSDCGADFVPPGASIHDELALLVDAGFTPAGALRAATDGAARFLHREGRTGRIAIGADADLVLLEADPLADIHATRRIAGVVLAGSWLDKPELERLREGAERFAQGH